MVSPFNSGPAHSFESMMKVVVHELIHLFVHKISNYQLSTWINEGTAVYYAFQGPPSQSTIENYINNLGDKPTLDELNNGYTFGDIGGYTFSYTIVEYIVEELGNDAMLSAFLASNTDYSIVGFENETEFQTAWHEYLDRKYLVTPANYSISTSPVQTDGGTVTGSGTYSEGETVYLKTTANEVYEFENWTNNGVAVSTNSTYSFIVSENINLFANFAEVTDFVQIIFQVDMVNEVVSSDGVFLKGTFDGWSNPIILGANGPIYSTTIQLQASDTIQYKYINGNQWEDFSGNCTVGEYNDR